MAKRRASGPSQLEMFVAPVLPETADGDLPRARAGRRRLGPFVPAPDVAEVARKAGQLTLFEPLPARAPSPKQLIRHRLRGRRAPQTYLELASALGLIRLHQLVKLPATYYFIDARPLQDELQVDTLLDARYRIIDHLMDAFDDLADLAPPDVRSAHFTLWGGRHYGVPTSVSPRGEALALAIAAPDDRMEDPFRLRLRGLPGYLGHSRGPSPFEEGEELISLYDRETLYNLLPIEDQPVTLERLLLG